MKHIGTFLVRIVSLVFILFAIGNADNIKEAVILCLHSIITETNAKKQGSEKNPNIDEQIIKICIGVMAIYMIYMLLKGDRLLSTLAFIIFAILVGYLLRQKTA